jgi:hypothetical protein
MQGVKLERSMVTETAAAAGTEEGKSSLVFFLGGVGVDVDVVGTTFAEE